MTWTYGYDAANELIGATETNSQSQTLVQASYTYDVFGHRIASSVALNGGSATVTQYVYNGDTLWAQLTSDGALQDFYVAGDRADQWLATIDGSGAVGYDLTDHLGSIRDVMNTSGQVIASADYDAFGNAVTVSNPSQLGSLMYAGYFWNPEIAAYTDGARIYGPDLHRFWTQDPSGLGPDSNNYRYVKNGPTNATDPTGRFLVAQSEKGALKVQSHLQSKFGLRSWVSQLSSGRYYVHVLSTSQKRIEELLNKPPDRYDGSLLMAALSPLQNLEIYDNGGIFWTSDTQGRNSDLKGKGDAVTTAEYAGILHSAMYWEALVGANWQFDGGEKAVATYLAQLRDASVGLANDKILQQLKDNPEILKTHLLVDGQLRSREELAKELDAHANSLAEVIDRIDSRLAKLERSCGLQNEIHSSPTSYRDFLEMPGAKVGPPPFLLKSRQKGMLDELLEIGTAANILRDKKSFPDLGSNATLRNGKLTSLISGEGEALLHTVQDRAESDQGVKDTLIGIGLVAGVAVALVFPPLLFGASVAGTATAVGSGIALGAAADGAIQTAQIYDGKRTEIDALSMVKSGLAVGATGGLLLPAPVLVVPLSLAGGGGFEIYHGWGDFSKGDKATGSTKMALGGLMILGSITVARGQLRALETARRNGVSFREGVTMESLRASGKFSSYSEGDLAKLANEIVATQKAVAKARREALLRWVRGKRDLAPRGLSGRQGTGPHDFVGPLQPGTTRLPAPTTGATTGTTRRVFTTTSGPVDLGRAGTGATGPGGRPTSPGAGGTFVTDVDITNPTALQHHIDNNIPKLGPTPKYVTEIEVPAPGVKVDPTEAVPRPTNGWIAPSTPGARVVRVWEIRWVPDPQGRGFDVPTLVEVTPGGK